MNADFSGLSVALATPFTASGDIDMKAFRNKPTPQGLVAHFKAAAEAAPGLPLIVYNVPGRTGSNLTPAALQELWQNPQVVAVKESSGNLAQISEVSRTLPKDKTLLSGDDNLAVASIAVGAEGLVSVLGNLVPSDTKQLVDAARAGKRDDAVAINNRLLPLIDALFVESNPIPLKAGLKILGLGEDHVRLPLTTATEATLARLRDALAQAGIKV